MDQTFAAGDVVRLRSGGPKMTVTGENIRKSAWPATVDVCWFLDGAPKPEFSSFPMEALTLAEPRAEPIAAEPVEGSKRRSFRRRKL